MTVETTEAKATGAGNDAATSFSFSPIVLFVSTDLEVTHVDADSVETVLTEDVDYTVVVSEYPGTGSITYPVSGDPLPTGESLVMKRVLDLYQETDLENQGGYYADVLEAALDRLCMQDIQQQEELDRAVKVPIGDTSTTMDDLQADLVSLAAIEADISTVAAIDTDVSTVAAVDTETATVAGIAADVTTVAGIAADVSAVAAVDTETSTVAGIAANVTTVAGITADVSAVAAVDTETSTVAGIAANVTTVAGIAADVTTVAASGAPAKADQATVDAGTDDNKYVTPAKLAGTIGATLQGYDADTLKADTTDDVSVGFPQASAGSYGEIADAGTLTVDLTKPTICTATLPAAGGGTHAVAPDATKKGGQVIDITNGATGPAAITYASFTKSRGVPTLTANKVNRATVVMGTISTIAWEHN